MWEPEDDPDESFRAGKIHFRLHGEKLHGAWLLLRLPRGKRRGKKNEWLLKKEPDEFAHGSEVQPITEERPESVLGNARQSAAAQQSHSRQPTRTRERHASGANPDSASTTKVTKASKQGRGSDLLTTFDQGSIPREGLPAFLPPQLATPSTSAPPDDAAWIHELKLDGYRMQARIQSAPQQSVRLLTRTSQDWTHRMPRLARALQPLAGHDAILDGEVVVFSPSGVTNFADLQAAFTEQGAERLTYVVFDLLHLDGHSTRSLPLLKRKQVLEELLRELPKDDVVRISEHIRGSAKPVYAKACAMGAEGIVTKRANGAYVAGRSRDWLKHKCHEEQELVICGFTPLGNGRYGVGALLLGYYRGDNLIYAGRTGTGFTQAIHRSLRDRLETIKAARSPFAKLPPGAERNVQWVKPKLVAQVSFANWTADHIVRQAAFKGLREDKPPRTIEREEGATQPPPRRTRKIAPRRAKDETDAHSAATELPILLTHPDRVLEEESGLTKSMLAHYYAAVTEHMWPHIEGRPVTLVRCQGKGLKSCFFQRHFAGTLPRGIEAVDVKGRSTGEVEPYLMLSSVDSVVELAQFGVLEIHAWGARSRAPDRPDQITIDLDPDVEIDWKTLAKAALDVRKRFATTGLKPFLKSTGGKGLHVVTPIKPKYDWPAVKEFAHRLVMEMEESNPKLYLTRMAKVARKGRIFLDYLRNDRGATAVVPYSPRARAGAPVALPLHWSELEERRHPDFSVVTFKRWAERLKRDPWSEFEDSARRW